jgi:MFS family permease
MKAVLKTFNLSRPLLAIYLDSLLTNTGYFLLIPILTIVLSKDKLLPLSEVATAVFILTISLKSAKFFTGSLLDSLNLKLGLVIGVAIAGASFFAMGYINALPLLVPLAILAGWGNSANNLTVKSLVANIADKNSSSLIHFSAINVLVNIAALVGAFIGSLLLARNLGSYIFQITGIFYLVAGVVVWLLLRRTEVADNSIAHINFWYGYKRVLSDRHYLKLLPLNFVGWFCYSQLYSTVPYFVSDRYGTADKVGILYMLNALAVILLQIPVSHYVLKKFPQQKPTYQLFASYLIFSLSFLVAGIYPSFAVLALTIAIFTLAEMLLTPSVDAIVSLYAPPNLRTTYFSVMSISRALGESFGGYAGLHLLGFWSERQQHQYFWFSLALLVLIASVVLWLTVRNEPEPVQA